MVLDRFGIADVFGCHPDTVRAWVREGCPAHREPGKKGCTNDEKSRLFDTVQVYGWLLDRYYRGRYW